MLAVVFCMGNR